MKHVLSASQYDRDILGDIFERTDYFRRLEKDAQDRRGLASRYAGRQLCTLFYEPSTRTRLSFESAGAKMGMGIVSTESAGEFSSAAKGEKLEDTIQVVNGYADVIVIRHPEPGSAAIAASVSEKPIINAGDGGNEHPTQAALDTYTIYERHNRLDGLHIAVGGDLRFGRTVRSLVQVMSRIYKDNSFAFIAPEELQLSEDVRESLDEMAIEYTQTDSRDEGVKGADVIYWTRVQEERLEDPAEKEAIKRAIERGAYILDKTVVPLLERHATILHPLPRRKEIHHEIDGIPQAYYMQQAHNGVPVRQALIDKIFEDEQAA